MTESKSGSKVGPGRPPLHTRFKEGQSGNPRRPRPAHPRAPTRSAISGRRHRPHTPAGNGPLQVRKIGPTTPCAL